MNVLRAGVQFPIREDRLAAKDRELTILRALIQCGISTPRCLLTQAQIADALARYRPDLPVWSANKRTTGSTLCPKCGAAVESKSGRKYYYCTGCSHFWARGEA